MEYARKTLLDANASVTDVAYKRHFTYSQSAECTQ